jgi:hypothetical protein
LFQILQEKEITICNELCNFDPDLLIRQFVAIHTHSDKTKGNNPCDDEAPEHRNGNNSQIIIAIYIYISKGVRGSIVVKALCYKPEGRGFETR